MLQKKYENRLTGSGKRKARKILVWVVSIAVTLVIFTVLIYWDTRESNKAKIKEITKKTAETIVHTPQSEDPGKITQFEISIPKIGVSAVVVPNVDGTKQTVYDEALKNGVAHFVGTALPSSGSNIFIFGHSSSIFGTGKYDKIFAKLNNLVAGDVVAIQFNGQSYNYKVVAKKIISPDDTSALSPTDSEQLTLMTCWPVGTSDKRLIVIADPA